jgi:Leucine-rich repeat (LRR) protein
LDLSQNKIKTIGNQLAVFKELKSLNLDGNLLLAGALDAVSSLSKLQNLSAGGNQLGLPVPKDPKNPQQSTPEPLPKLPTSLKSIKLDSNSFSSFPMQIVAPNCLTKLERIDFSSNNMAAIPEAISNLVGLTELNLDNNVIVALPTSIGALKKLKTLSLKNNKISVSNTKFSDTNPQPLPASLFEDTLLIDLNLHGNPLSSTQLNEFKGYDKFLEKRKMVKSKDIYGGALTNLDVCGLE